MCWPFTEITHYGLRGALGSDVDVALSGIYALNKKVRAAADRVRKDLRLGSNVEAVEEVLADMPDSELVKLKGWRALVKRVRNWLRKAGATRLAARLDAWMKAGLDEQERADLVVADIVTAAREWVRSGRTGPGAALYMGVTRLAETEAGFDVAVRQIIADSVAGRRLPSAPVHVAEHSPVALRILGWDDLPVAMSPKEIDKVHFDHGMTADRIAKLVPETLEDPSLMLLSATVPGRVVMVARETGDKPVLLVVSPETDIHRDGAPQRKGHLIVSMYPKDEGWDWVARQIRNGNLLYRDPGSDAAKKTSGATSDAQKKFAQTGRKLMGLIPKRGAELLGEGYKVLLPSDLRKWETENGQRLSRAPATPDAASPRQPATNLPQSLRKRWTAYADRVIGRMDSAINGLHGLPDQARYLADRYLAMGRIGQIDEIAGTIRKSFGSATAEDKKAVYTYLTTRGAESSQINDTAVRDMAEKTKKYIGTVGDALVARGLIPEASREEYRDRYLPRLYLAHLLDDSSWRAIGAGKKVSDQGYLKERNKDLPEEYRQVILGEVTDPSFLAASAIAQPMRDMAILDWLEKISSNEQWVWRKDLAMWGGRKVSTHWLMAESDAMLQRAQLYDSDADAKKAEAVANEMRKTALAAMSEQPKEPGDYKRIPDTARYGRLRGLLVRREIYDDLIGLGEGIPRDAGWAEKALGQGGAGTKVQQLWKTSKVALNPPGQIRNFISNAVLLQLSGVPLHRLPWLFVRAMREMSDGGAHYQVAKKYGVTVSTFTAQELFRAKRDLLELEREMRGNHPVLAIQRVAAFIMDKAGDAYQWSETIMKVTKIIDAMEREKLGEADAALEAQKWVFDYSLVDRNVRYLRNAPVGMPFLTFSVKVAPRLLEVAAKHPQRFLPWAVFFYGAFQAAAMALGGGGDEWEKLRMALPEWLRKKPHALPLPWRDAEGRIQFADVGYFFPWQQWLQLASEVSRGEVSDAMRTAGIIGGPAPDLIVATKTGIDPFTKREIANDGDPPVERGVAWLNYAWNMAAPPFLTSNGFASPMGLIDKQYGGKLVQGVSGTTDKYGDPRATTPQAIIGLLGVNVEGVNPGHSRTQELKRLMGETIDSKQRLKQRMQDQSLTPEEQQKLRKTYQDEMVKRAGKVREYSDESTVPEFARPRK